MPESKTLVTSSPEARLETIVATSNTISLLMKGPFEVPFADVLQGTGKSRIPTIWQRTKPRCSTTAVSYRSSEIESTRGFTSSPTRWVILLVHENLTSVHKVTYSVHQIMISFTKS